MGTNTKGFSTISAYSPLLKVSMAALVYVRVFYSPHAASLGALYIREYI